MSKLISFAYYRVCIFTNYAKWLAFKKTLAKSNQWIDWLALIYFQVCTSCWLLALKILWGLTGLNTGISLPVQSCIFFSASVWSEWLFWCWDCMSGPSCLRAAERYQLNKSLSSYQPFEQPRPACSKKKNKKKTRTEILFRRQNNLFSWIDMCIMT